MISPCHRRKTFRSPASSRFSSLTTSSSIPLVEDIGDQASVTFSNKAAKNSSLRLTSAEKRFGAEGTSQPGGLNRVASIETFAPMSRDTNRRFRQTNIQRRRDTARPGDLRHVDRSIFSINDKTHLSPKKLPPRSLTLSLSRKLLETLALFSRSPFLSRSTCLADNANMLSIRNSETNGSAGSNRTHHT